MPGRAAGLTLLPVTPLLPGIRLPVPRRSARAAALGALLVALAPATGSAPAEAQASSAAESYRAAARETARLQRAPDVPGDSGRDGAIGLTGTVPAARPTGDGPSPAVLALAGVGAAAAGIVGGFLLGGDLADNDTSDGFDALTGGLVGAMVGTTVAVPLTVHVVNGTRGSWIAAQGASVGAAAAGLGVAALLNATGGSSDTGQAILAISIPLGQVAASVAVEKGTADGGN